MDGLERHGSGGPFEQRVGYSRIIRAGNFVVVAGTTALTPDGVIAHVIRTRVFLVETGHFDGFARAHGEAFGDIRPVNTTVVVAELADPRMLIEIEVDAFLPDAAGA